MNLRVRELTSLRAVEATPSESELALLAGEDYAGQEVTADEVRVRRMLLCHDQYDRSGERFPRAYLSQFAATLPGKSVLAGHDKGELPLGRFFRAQVTRREEAEFPILRREKASEPVPSFDPQPALVQWCQAGFYYPNDAEAAGLDNRIKLGVYRSVSIGFRFDDLLCDLCGQSYLRSDCPHVARQWDDERKALCTCTYGGDAQKAEALEGSIVFLGAQPQARLIKSMTEAGEVDPHRLAWTPFGEDLVALKEAEALARQFGHAERVWAVKEMGGGMGGMRCGAARNLSIVNRGSWDGPAAMARMFTAAGWPDDPDPAMARKGFLIYDSAEPDLKGSYKLPFADMASGRMVAVDAGLRAAASRLPQTDAPQAVKDRARAVLDAYFARMEDMGEDRAGVPGEKESDMPDSEKGALDQAAADLKAAQDRATTAETERDTAKAALATAETEKAEALAKLAAVEPLAEIGTQALKDLQEAILADDLAITGQKENAELADLVALHVERRNYPRLRELAAAKAAAKLAKFPAGKRGSVEVSQAEAETPDRTPLDIIQAALA